MTKNKFKNQKTILIADDDEAIVEAISLILTEAGYKVVTTLNGTVFDKISEYHPSLVLMDIWMPGMDGGSLCLQIKNQTDTKHLPIIIVSASKDAAKLCEACGADAYLGKPFEMQALLDLVAKYV